VAVALTVMDHLLPPFISALAPSDGTEGARPGLIMLINEPSTGLAPWLPAAASPPGHAPGRAARNPISIAVAGRASASSATMPGAFLLILAVCLASLLPALAHLGPVLIDA
jgi:hypothetical protein